MKKEEVKEILKKCFGKEKDDRYHAIAMLTIYGIFILILVLVIRLGGTNSSNMVSNPTTSPTTTPTASGTTYTVKSGDTGEKICKSVYGEYTKENWSKILKANNMNESSTYHPGQELIIP